MWRSILSALRSDTQAFLQWGALIPLIENGKSMYAVVSVLSLLITLLYLILSLIFYV